MMITQLFKAFYKSEKAGGLLLVICTMISLLIANSGWGETYLHFWHQKLDLSVAGLQLNYSIEQWINDGLMTIFFLLVGLEIERELYAGELASFSNALLPIAAAFGGMLVPAAIHYLINSGTPTQSGFGIPMATDIAFALGMLALAGKRVPYSLRIFLTALAIIDDIGAILVIAIFYNTGIQWLYLGLSGGILLILFMLSRAKVHHLAFYLLPRLVLWYCMMQSGVHPTIAGVLLAFVIPFSGNTEDTPSYKLQHVLHKPVAFIILRLFALANTGIVLSGNWMQEIISPNGAGIIGGLVLGKPIGIIAACYVLIKFTKVTLPEYANWKQLTGVAVLGGIGFTMSIFISNLAFTDGSTIGYAKAAVLIASVIASAVGLLILLPGKKNVRVRKSRMV